MSDLWQMKLLLPPSDVPVQGLVRADNAQEAEAHFSNMLGVLVSTCSPGRCVIANLGPVARMPWEDG